MTPRLVLLPQAGRSLAGWRDRLAEQVPQLDVLLAPAEAGEDELAGLLTEAEAAFGTLTPRLLAAAGRLRWLHSPQANPPSGYFFPELVESDVVVTNVRGIYGDSVGVHAIALLLALARRLDVYRAQQDERGWRPDEGPVLHLDGATLLVAGLGSVGAEIGRLAAALGMTVLATDARPGNPPPGVAEVHGPDALDALLPRADAVVNVLPETTATAGTFHLARFRRMRRGALYVTVGRGATTVTADLARALSDGLLGAAGVDVADPEPLPADSPLWSAPRALITPHVADRGPDLEERRYAVLAENCRRFAAGEPLVNVVDKAAGF
ncbi:D-2-hydroxyacid dehydrogenase [Modestobacter sp. SYSU DS0875]